MHMELLGFAFGVIMVGAVGLILINRERWRAISSVYGRDSSRKPRHGNALIWPSH